MQKTDIDEWERIGEIVKQVDRDVVGMVRVLNSVPKTVWREEHDKAEEGLTALRSVLEDRLAEEHPDEWDTDFFYGTGDLDATWEK